MRLPAFTPHVALALGAAGAGALYVARRRATPAPITYITTPGPAVNSPLKGELAAMQPQITALATALGQLAAPLDHQPVPTVSIPYVRDPVTGRVIAE